MSPSSIWKTCQEHIRSSIRLLIASLFCFRLQAFVLVALSTLLVATVSSAPTNDINVQSQLTTTTLQQLLQSQGLSGNKDQVLVLLVQPQQLLQSQTRTALPTQNIQSINSAAATASGDNSVTRVTPLNINYQSQSVPLNVVHTHTHAPKPETQLARSEEEPHVLIHEIIRPVIQEVREIIQPYRRIIQEIRPVQEQVVSQVHKKKDASVGAASP